MGQKKKKENTRLTPYEKNLIVARGLLRWMKENGTEFRLHKKLDFTKGEKAASTKLTEVDLFATAELYLNTDDAKMLALLKGGVPTKDGGCVICGCDDNDREWKRKLKEGRRVHKHCFEKASRLVPKHYIVEEIAKELGIKIGKD